MTSPELEPTGERLIPERQRGELVHAEHLARYRLAAQLAEGRQVLDVACGEGYGTAMLSAAGAAGATGVDVDSAAVEHARSHHAIDARVADIRSLPFDDGAYDLVVSFETIEHVEEPERALDELARVCAPGGLLVISTPNAGQYLVENEFHVREFEHDEFVGMLRERFAEVRLLFQHNWLTSAILGSQAMGQADGETGLPVDLTKVTAVEPGGELYLLAVCGGAVDVPLRDVGVMAGTDAAHELAHRLNDAVQTQALYSDAHQDAERRLQEIRETAQEIRETARWMRSTWSWRLTKPFRLPARLWRRQ
jgi:2-polyprenyl-3-methyl-5-hydroxy-6-metoxy-1,4-benzoquinol methylase